MDHFWADLHYYNFVVFFSVTTACVIPRLVKVIVIISLVNVIVLTIFLYNWCQDVEKEFRYNLAVALIVMFQNESSNFQVFLEHDYPAFFGSSCSIADWWIVWLWSWMQPYRQSYSMCWSQVWMSTRFFSVQNKFMHIR